jgi:ribosomal protein L11 methyltransferase
MTSAPAGHDTVMQQPPVWTVTVAVDATVAWPNDEACDREAFVESLWARYGDAGLCGIFEGAVDTAEAAALGLVESSVVLDAAAAPADRDWVACLPKAEITLWFDAELAARAAATDLAGTAGCRVLDVRLMPHDADARSWQQEFRVIDVPGFGLVCPPWDVAAESTRRRPVVVIDPGCGFGTGLHETTQLCLAALASCSRAEAGPRRVLDYGSGSGILAIAAAVLGAEAVDAIEIDTRVHPAILDNARRNSVADRVHVAAELPPIGEPYDVVVANIVAPVLLADADALCERLRRGGTLVLSGLLDDNLPAIIERFQALIRTRPDVSHSGNWRCLMFTHPIGGLQGQPPMGP